MTGVQRVQAGVQLPGPLRLLVGRPAAAARGPRRPDRAPARPRPTPRTSPPRAPSCGRCAIRELQLAPAFAVSGALRRRLDAAGETRLRVYALDVRHSGAHAGVDVGVGLGGGYEHAVERARLVGAGEREAGGAWRERDDCLVAA